MAWPLTPELRNKIELMLGSYVTSFNRRKGRVILTYNDVITALGFVPSSGSSLPAGGTTNQVLSKQSNTDFDVLWQTIDLSTKQDADGDLAAIAALTGLGYAKRTGTNVWVLDNSTFLTNIAGIAAGGDLSGTYPNPSVLNSAVLAKVLTGLNVVGSSLVATDNLLEAFGKLQNQINSILGGAIYQSTWAASTNTPTLANGVGTKGHYYVASDNGSVNFGAGAIDFKTGDWAIYNGTIWEKVDNTDAVASVNGFIGAVNLTSADIAEVTNLYFTTARVLATTLTGYVSGAGVITAADTILQAIQKLNGNADNLQVQINNVSPVSSKIFNYINFI